MTRTIFLFLPVPLLLAVLLIPESKMIIFPPDPARHCPVAAYADTFYTMSGSTGRLAETSDTSVVFEFEARPTHLLLAVQPVSGVQFGFGNATLDISRYDLMEFELGMTNASSCNVSMVTAGERTGPASMPQLWYWDAVAALRPGAGIYRLDLKAFTSPEWWKARITRTGYLSRRGTGPDFSKVVALRFGTDHGCIRSTNAERLEIRRIELRKNRRTINGIALGGSAAWLVLALTATWFFRQRVRSRS